MAREIERVIQCAGIDRANGKRCEKKVECSKLEEAKKMPKLGWELINAKWYCPQHAKSN